MKTIKNLLEHIEEEIDDAEKYAMCFQQEDDPALKALYKELALAELDHSGKLHTQAERLKNDYANKGYSVPESMMEIYKWEHQKAVDLTDKIREMLGF